MKLVKPFVELLWITPDSLGMIEAAGRTCYKSEDKIEKGTDLKFAQKMLNRGHEAMIEHASMSMRVVCDRGVTHEIVRHRLFSYAQESTRYCNYSGGVTFVVPCWFETEIKNYDKVAWDEDTACDHAYKSPEGLWLAQMMWSEKTYIKLLKDGWSPQQARSVLPNSLKTEIVITGNLREWRHFFNMRCASTAHPQMREVSAIALDIAQEEVPVLFDDFSGV